MTVRFLPNPYYIDGLREKTGNDPEVQDYVMGNEKAGTVFGQIKGHDRISDSELYSGR